MSNKINVQVSRRGMSFAGMLTLIFVVAKLFSLITWSWWLVFLPIYALPLAALSLFLVVAIIGGVIAALS